MKASEKRLLFTMLGMLLLGGIVIGSDFYFDKRDLLQGQQGTLQNEWVVIETLFEEKEIWDIRSNWLDQHQPKFTTTEQIDQAIYKESLAEGAEGVSTSKQNLLPTLTTPDYIQAGVALTASGELGHVLRWLYDLNRPEDFRVVRNLKIAPDKEAPEKVLATFELLRWYAPQAPES